MGFVSFFITVVDVDGKGWRGFDTFFGASVGVVTFLGFAVLSVLVNSLVCDDFAGCNDVVLLLKPILLGFVVPIR